MKKTALPFIALLALLFTACTPLTRTWAFRPHKLTGTPNSPEKEGWVLTFSDEFNAGKLDESKWSTLPYYGLRYHTGLPYQHYCDDCFEFTDSTIRLPVKTDTTVIDGMTFPYAVGFLDNSKVFDQQYGYFEIRCKIPSSVSTWPAFWLVSRHSWPPEIDIFEFYTSHTQVRLCSNYHWKDSTGRKKSISDETKHIIPDPAADFHVYGCEWDETSIRWYFDNMLIREVKQDTSEFRYPMHIIVNNAVLFDKALQKGRAEFPAWFEVDYVRAWQRPERLGMKEDKP